MPKEHEFSMGISIAADAKVAADVHFQGSGRVIIGPSAVIESGVLIDTGRSPISTVELSSRSKLKYGAVLRTYDGFIRVGERASIGEYSVLSGHGGLTIGNLVIIAVIGAGSIVTRNIPDNFICHGTPCRPIRKRI